MTVGIIMMPSATPPAKAEKCPVNGKTDVRADDQRIDGDAHHDRGNAVEHIGGEANRIGQLGAATELGQKDAAADADGNADEAGQAEQNCRADDGVGHAAAGFADRLGNLGEEVQVQRTGALVDRDKRRWRPAAQPPARWRGSPGR